jgi:hypothetical protein
MENVVDKSGPFLASQLRSLTGSAGARRYAPAAPAVTISHQTGAGAHEIAERLAELLHESDTEGQPWAVVDRQLVEKALEEHHWPKHLAKKMPEDKRSYVDDVLDDLFGLRPPSWVLVPHVVETMLHLVEAGRVILIGRGAAIVTAPLPNVFHVRLVASLATRARRVQADLKLTSEAATQYVEKEDRGRRRYVKANFQARLDNELLYDLVVNTERLPCSDAAALIAEGARRWFQGNAVARQF